MTVNFNDFRTTNSDTQNLIKALKYCEINGADTLRFEKGIYEFSDNGAPEIMIDVSNHGDTNRRKSVFLLKNINSLTVDGNGSTFIFKGITNAFTLIGCSSVTLKNFTVEFPDYPYPNGFVEKIGDTYFDLRFDSENVFCDENGRLFVQSGNFCDKVHCDVCFDRTTHEIVHGTGDNSLGVNINKLNCKKLENGLFRFFDPPKFPTENDVFALLTGIRRASGILLDNSTDTNIQNVTIHSCIGIGIMAQCCHNVTIDNCRVTATDGRYVSSAADATHFVCCTGTVNVTNSQFEHMLDDALNVHGIYTKIIEADGNSATVKFMNSASVGINIYKSGDKLAVVDPDSLKPSAFLTVKAAQMTDREHTKLTFRENAELKVGDLVDNLTRYPELNFENNCVQNNRARGMLIATNKKATVKNCRFHTSGSAIVLECDGKFWFESGAVTDLTIENNLFDNCRYANWDKGVISIPEGKKIIDSFYYHKKISIINNRFQGHLDDDVYADNVSELIFEGNESDSPTLRLCHVGKATIQSDAKINAHSPYLPLMRKGEKILVIHSVKKP